MTRFPVFLYAMLMIPTTACGNAASAPEPPAPQESAPQAAEQDANESMQPEPAVGRQIQIAFGENTLVYELNDSQAAADLYDQLPLTLEIEDYSTNEKIFYPPEALDTTDAPQAEGGAGVLAYYEPWGDVVLFYDDFSMNGSLYALGQIASGSEQIRELTGTVTIEKVG